MLWQLFGKRPGAYMGGLVSHSLHTVTQQLQHILISLRDTRLVPFRLFRIANDRLHLRYIDADLLQLVVYAVVEDPIPFAAQMIRGGLMMDQLIPDLQRS